MSSEIHVGDIGTKLNLVVKDDNQIVDISAATDLKVFITKPNTVKLTKTATLYTDGTDGLMTYTAVNGDFDVPGVYKIQGMVVLPGGTFHGNVSTFKVYCNL